MISRIPNYHINMSDKFLFFIDRRHSHFQKSRCEMEIPIHTPMFTEAFVIRNEPEVDQ